MGTTLINDKIAIITFLTFYKCGISFTCLTFSVHEFISKIRVPILDPQIREFRHCKV